MLGRTSERSAATCRSAHERYFGPESGVLQRDPDHLREHAAGLSAGDEALLPRPYERETAQGSRLCNPPRARRVVTPWRSRYESRAARLSSETHRDLRQPPLVASQV